MKMIKPIITISSTGAKIKSNQWATENMFNASILLCWVDFLNDNLDKESK